MGLTFSRAASPIPRPPRGLAAHHWLNFLQAAYRLEPGPSAYDFHQLRRFLKLALETPVWMCPINYSLLASLLPKGYPGRVNEILNILIQTQTQVPPHPSSPPLPSPPPADSDPQIPPPYAEPNAPQVLPVMHPHGAPPSHRPWQMKDLQAIKQEVSQAAPGSPQFMQTVRLAVQQFDPTAKDLQDLLQYLCSSLVASLHHQQLDSLISEAETRGITGYNPLAGPLRVQANNPQQQGLRREYQQLWLSAFSALPGNAKDPSWASILQGLEEPYHAFVERLNVALDNGLPEGTPKDPILRSLAYSNANKECQKLLQARGHTNSPLGDMLRACQAWAPKDKAKVLVVQSKKPPPTQPCFRCGKPGHWSRDCTQPRPPPGPCPLCQDPTHWKRDCPRLRPVEPEAEDEALLLDLPTEASHPKKLHGGGGLTSPLTTHLPSGSRGPASVLPIIPLDPDHRPLIQAQIEAQPNPPKTVEALLDTGADITVLPLALFPNETPLENTSVLGAGGQTQDHFKITSLPVIIRLPFRTTPVVLTSCLVDIKNNWAIIGRDALQQCQGVLYLPETKKPHVLLPIQAPALLGLEHLPQPPEISQFPLNRSASRPCNTWSNRPWRPATSNHTQDQETIQCSRSKRPMEPGDSSMI
uniref:Gag-Pro polyprotein n=1 Tax=Simian T-lymphotropic virus 1 TaxID=33747 RepID=A0A4Y6I0K3_9STL1|nr:gag/pro precursor [Simian T-lymphotropic virus 1]